MGWFARSGISRLIVRVFVRVYGLNMDEATAPVESYNSLEDLFTRTVKEGARPIDPSPDALVSPVDARVAAVGISKDGRIPLSTDRHLDLSNLFETPLDEERDAIVLYLSPKDYHRVHVPREGQITHWAYIPGTLWPVFPAAVRRVKGLFSRNERALIRIQSDIGQIDVAMVGAFGVGRMTLACCDLITNTGGEASQQRLEAAVHCSAGDELGVFHLGSTVVLMTPKAQWKWCVKPGDVVQMGQAIGHL